jgi:hypothetical protein
MTFVKKARFIRDAARCAAFISRQNPDAAFRFLIAAENACQFLSASPRWEVSKTSGNWLGFVRGEFRDLKIT